MTPAGGNGAARWLATGWALGLVLSSTLGAGAVAKAQAIKPEPRYVAQWVDGTETEAHEVENWHRSGLKPSLANSPLFDDANPLRSLIDRTLPRGSQPASYIEFHGGDRLPGRVLGFVDADETPGTPAHLLVAPDMELGMPQLFLRARVRVMADWVHRVVQPPVVGPLPPGTLERSDGSRLTFRNHRWRSEGIDVLTETGLKQTSYGELTALDLPLPLAMPGLNDGPATRLDPWQAWFRQLACLCPGLDSRIVRLETIDGLRLTSSLERMRPRSLSEDPEQCFLWLQPAWSLDLLAVSHRKTRIRAFFSPREIPLSMLEASASRHRPVFSAGWSVHRVDSSVQGSALKCGGREFAWGFGVHAHHELDFQTPALARRFRTRLGLDGLAGAGGCVRGKILLDDRPLFESPTLTGSERVVDTGWLNLSGRKGTLRLLADSQPADRPRQADPYDIRDLFDWLEPQLELDPILLRGEVEKYFPQVHPRLAGWKLDPVEVANWRPANRFDESDRGSPGFRSLMLLAGRVTLAREFPIEPGRETLVLWFGRPEGATASGKFEVLVDGRRLLRDSLPAPPASEEALPVEISLAAHVGRTVEVSVRLDPGGKPGLVDWRGSAWKRTE